MKKFRGQGKLTKLITSRIAALNRSHFLTLIHNPRQLKCIVGGVTNNQTVGLELVSFSSSNDYPEQVLSILSFLRHVGTPLSWTIYSDGSHSEEEVKALQTVLTFVKIINENINEAYFESNTLKLTLRPYKHELHDFAQHHVMGKKLCLYLNHAVNRPTLFLDSDIVFYKKSSLLKNLFTSTGQGWFLPDQGWGCLHSRYVANRDPEHYQVNVGFFLINSELADPCDGLRFLKKIEHDYEYFTEQTVLHIIFNANRFMPLDPRQFIVDTHDQFDFSYVYARDGIAIRHYTGPVRHKMWQREWKWHLSLT